MSDPATSAPSRARGCLVNLALLCAGILVTALLLEAGLRVLALRSDARPAVPAAKLDTPVVLCLGDSFTLGRGAPRGHAFSDYLAQCLAASGPSCTVVNLGVDGHNTAHILRNASQALQELQPAIVIFQGGSVNFWNLWGYATDTDNPPVPWWQRVLHHSRLYVLVQHIRLQVDQRRARHAAPELDAGSNAFARGMYFVYDHDSTTARRIFRAAVDDEPTNALLYAGFAVAARLDGNYAEATAMLQRGLHVLPNNPLLHFHLAECAILAADYAGAARWCRQGLERAPLCLSLREQLASLRHLVPVASEQLTAFLASLATRHTGALFRLPYVGHEPPAENTAATALATTNQQAIMEWVRADLRRLASACHEHGAALVLHNYPIRPRQLGAYDRSEYLVQHCLANDTVKAAAAELGLPFVDQRRAFDTLPNKTPYFEPNSIDEHCSAQGYAFMASNLLPVVSVCLTGTPVRAEVSVPGRLDCRFDYVIADRNLVGTNLPGLDRLYEHIRRGDYESALFQASRVLATCPSNAVLWNVAAGLHGSNGEHERAGDAARRALALRPRDSLTRFNLATSAMAGGLDPAGRALQPFHDDPRFAPQALNNSACGAWLAGCTTSALARLSTLISNHPRYGLAYLNRAAVRAGVADIDGALDDAMLARVLGRFVDIDTLTNTPPRQPPLR